MNKQNMKPEYKLRWHSFTYNYIIIYYKKLGNFYGLISVLGNNYIVLIKAIMITLITINH